MTQMFRRLLASAACWTVAALVCAAPAAGQEAQPQPRELADWEREELQALVEAVTAARTGEAAPAADPFELAPSYLKGTDGNTYVPFTLTLDPAQIDGSNVAVYLYVDDPAAAAAAEEAEDSDDEPQEAVFEDAYFIRLGEPGADDMVRINRAFSAPGGEYDVYVAMRRSLGEDPDDDELEALPVMLLKRSVPVPDLWTEELQTSTVLIAQEVEPLAAPLSPEEQIENPYTLGTTRIVPKFDRVFGNQEDLNLLMLVYNPRLADNMPNITVEYNFHQQTEAGEEFFNKTNPQEFNAQTLPPGFSVEAGHQIVAGQSVPLSLFPAGDYRLEISITDNEAGTNLTRDVNFTIGES